MSCSPGIDLIIGPMFSGKTTELMRILSSYVVANVKVIYINSAIDTRSESEVSSHNKNLTYSSDIHLRKSDELSQDLFEKCCLQYDVIAIDESQFFKGLYDFCVRLCEVGEKKVIVAGLNGTSDRLSFGEINSLIPVCDNVTFLHATCSICSKDKRLSRAIFSKRTVLSDAEICVGGIESYIPVCRKHYFL